MKKLTIELDENTFAWLEVLVVGLAQEQYENDEYKNAITDMVDSDDSFSKGVSKLLQDTAFALSVGIKRSGSWERGVLESLTGYQGAYVPSMFDKCIKEEAEQRGFKFGDTAL